MIKHPSAFRLSGRMEELNESALHSSQPIVLYDGDFLCFLHKKKNVKKKSSAGGIRALCHLAPNNVNTMAAAAIAAHNLGFDKVRGKLIADSEYVQFSSKKKCGKLKFPGRKDGTSYRLK
jgi:aspartate dehydrogenase